MFCIRYHLSVVYLFPPCLLFVYICTPCRVNYLSSFYVLSFCTYVSLRQSVARTWYVANVRHSREVIDLTRSELSVAVGSIFTWSRSFFTCVVHLARMVFRKVSFAFCMLISGDPPFYIPWKMDLVFLVQVVMSSM